MYRIYRACSSWQLFHESMEKAKRVLECNQYPPNFYDLIIKDSLNIILRKCQQTEHPSEENTTIKKFPLMIPYRGKCSAEYAHALHRCSAPCTIIMTIRKLRTTMPSLKPPVEKMIRTGIVYKITCPRCTACYVGQSSRHLQTHFREHTRNPGPVKTHLRNCNTTITEEHIDILAFTSRGEGYLLPLEALFTQELEPKINTKDEWWSRTLTIKI